MYNRFNYKIQIIWNRYCFVNKINVDNKGNSNYMWYNINYMWYNVQFIRYYIFILYIQISRMFILLIYRELNGCFVYFYLDFFLKIRST